MWRFNLRIFTLVLLLIAVEQNAKAYADPGSGALLWQILLGGAVGALFYVRRAMSWLRGRLRPERNVES